MHQLGIYVLQVSDRFTFAHSILYCARSARSNDKWTSTVHHTAEVMSMYQAGRMAPQQMAVLWQVCARSPGLLAMLYSAS